jgi:hypothetical protein
MNVLFETTWLAPGQAQAAKDVRFNARQVVDEAQFFRAAFATYYPRGNVECSLEFVTQWIFTSTQLAENFVLTVGTFYPMTNADNGVLQCVIGAETPNPITIYSPSAVLESVEVLNYVGMSVDVRYRLRCQPFQSSIPPNTPSFPNPNVYVYVLQRGNQSIGSGATSGTVTFTTPFSSTPIVTGSVNQQSGSQGIAGRILQNTITVNGFTFELDAAAPDGSYVFSWIAMQ